MKFKGSQASCGRCTQRDQCLRHNKQLNRFTLRNQTKVDGQCKLYAFVHNMKKLAHHGYAQKGKPGNCAKRAVQCANASAEKRQWLQHPSTKAKSKN